MAGERPSSSTLDLRSDTPAAEPDAGQEPEAPPRRPGSAVYRPSEDALLEAELLAEDPGVTGPAGDLSATRAIPTDRPEPRR